MRRGGLVLAAGAGTRFGPHQGRKLLATLEDGRPVLEHALAPVCALEELARVVVVVGAGAHALLDVVAVGRARVVRCDTWADGQAESLRAGVQALEGCSEVLVALGDEPRVPVEAFRRVLAAGAPARACWGGRPGHPVLLGPVELAAIRRGAPSGDQGARDLLSAAARIECTDLGSVADIDTPDDLEAIRHETRAVL